MRASVLGIVERREGSRRPALRAVIRVLGAALTAAMGLIHLLLWLQGYREVPVIGTLFMINAICAAALVVALLAVPARLRAAVAAVGALFTAETLGALVLSLTVGLFGVHESLQTPLVPTTLIVESVGVVMLTLMAMLEMAQPRAQR